MGNTEDRPSNRQDNQTPFIRRAGFYLGVATELAGTIIGGPLVGYALDRYFATSPWFLLGMTGIAFVGGFLRLLQWVRFFARDGNGKNIEKDHTAH